MTPDAVLFLILLGVPLLVWAAASARALARALSTRHWQPAPGHVVQVTSSYWRSFRLPLRLARIEYRYSVAGTTYTNTDLGGGEDRTLASLWPPPHELMPGAPVTAYVDPATPSRAVLYQGASFYDWLSVATPLAGFALVVWELALR